MQQPSGIRHAWVQTFDVKTPAAMPPGFEQAGIDVVLSQLEPTWGDGVQNMRRHLPVADARNVVHPQEAGTLGHLEAGTFAL